jgi:hypothetical protein
MHQRPTRRVCYGYAQQHLTIQPIYLLQPFCYSLFGADFDAINTQRLTPKP